MSAIDPDGSSKIFFDRLSWSATMPTPTTSGYTLYSNYTLVIPPWGKGLVKTDVVCSFPADTYGRLAGLNSCCSHCPLCHCNIGGGVVDYDYRGNIGVGIFNHGPESVAISCGDPVAQLILSCIATPQVQEVAKLPAAPSSCTTASCEAGRAPGKVKRVHRGCRGKKH